MPGANRANLEPMINIEIQNKHGAWKRYSTVPNEEDHISRALQAAAAHPLAVDVRAVGMETKRAQSDC